MILSMLIVITAQSLLVRAQSGSSLISNIPGAKTATDVLAASTDGVSRYLAPDGPIQPAITAIGGLPMRGAELANKGITQISSGLNSGAQSLSRSAGSDGQIRMPGLDALESSMPASIASLGGMMHGAIQQKNNFIRGQAEKGVQAGERLRSMMQNGLQGMTVRSSGHMAGMANMMSGAQDMLTKGTSQIQGQLKQSLSGHMGRMQAMQGIGDNVRNQAQGLTRTLSNGLSGTVDHLQRTGDQVKNQLQNGLHQNTQAMSGIMGSMQGGIGNMGDNMQKNLHGVLRHAQNAAQQVTSQIQQVANVPMSMIQNLGSMMMHSTGGQSGKY